MFYETGSEPFIEGDFSTLTTPDLGHFFAVLHQDDRVQETYLVLSALEKAFDTYGWEEESWS